MAEDRLNSRISEQLAATSSPGLGESDPNQADLARPE
jgi:hypothetical protein